MADLKNSTILLYLDDAKLLNMLTAKSERRVMHALFEYVQSNPIEQLSNEEKIVFTAITTHIDRDAKKYNEKIQKLRENASLGGKANAENHSSKSNQMLANASKSNQMLANDPLKDKDKVLVSLINNNTSIAPACEDVDNLRKPFLKFYEDYFLTSGSTEEYEQLALEVIDTMILARQKAIENGLKFNNKNYSSQDFVNLLLKIDSEKLSKIVNTLKFTETEIKDRFFYILGCIINQANEKVKAVAV